MNQPTINQRIKFLLEHYKLSVRAFSELIGHKAANTQNYVGTRGSMPGADYLQSIIEHFEGVNPVWLLTGRGEPFLQQLANSSKVDAVFQQGNSIYLVEAKSSTVTQHNYTIEDCEKERDRYQAERNGALKVIELLNGQLAMKDTIIKAKDDYIQLLKETYRPPAD